jgi:hypothetical protein
MYTEVPTSGEFLKNYVALLWAKIGQPCLRAFDVCFVQIFERCEKRVAVNEGEV